jgi:hypothetical protein
LLVFRVIRFVHKNLRPLFDLWEKCLYLFGIFRDKSEKKFIFELLGDGLNLRGRLIFIRDNENLIDISMNH